jgi:aryl-alcohol dehydrogenase-like predicted oxidoreductase
MKFTKLGRSGLDVSLICLGTMTWGQQNSEAEAFEQMDYAVERGVNFFDVAEVYPIPPKPETQGATETIIGRWLKSRGGRDKIVLATKVAGRSAMTWLRADGSPTELSRKQMTEAVDGSLRRLQTEVIDLYQLHYPDRPVPWGANPTRFKAGDYEGASHPIQETLEVLQDFVRAGKIRHIGLSNESAWGTMSFLKDSEMRGLPRVQSIQNAYHLLNRTFETGHAEIALREQVGLLAYSPLGQGFLTGKYLGGARPPNTRTTLFDRGQRYQRPGAEEAIAEYVALAHEFGIDPAQMALAFVNAQPFTTATIIGATSMEQLKTNIASIEITLSPELTRRIDEIHQLHGNPAP